MKKNLLLALSMAVLGMTLPACLFVDNSGGEKPPGEDVSVHTNIDVPNLAPCYGGVDDASILDSETAVDEWLTDCQSFSDDVQAESRAALLGVIDDLDEDEKFIGVRITLGGCVQQWNFMSITQEDKVLHVWGLKEDTSYGLNETACTDDIGWHQSFYIASEGDVANATSADLVTGVFNPQLPNAPALPGG